MRSVCSTNIFFNLCFPFSERCKSVLLIFRHRLPLQLHPEIFFNSRFSIGFPDLTRLMPFVIPKQIFPNITLYVFINSATKYFFKQLWHFSHYTLIIDMKSDVWKYLLFYWFP